MAEVDREPFNRLRVDLYRRLLPRIQREDQTSGARGYVIHWDDPDAQWDEAVGPQAAVQNVWDEIGLAPLVQELFFVIEQMEGEELEVLESVDALVDPLRCPESLLGNIAASFGYRLKEDISEDKKRLVVLGLQQAFKSIGQFVGFKVFYRMLGFEVIDIFPLFKKAINESQDRYSRTRFVVTPIIGQPIGPSGTQVFTGQIPDAPAKPGTVRITDTATVLRSTEEDEEPGNLIGPSGVVGTFNHETGRFTFDLGAPAVGAVTANYDRVDDEFPFQAARIEIEISLNPGGDVICDGNPGTPFNPLPFVDSEVVDSIIERMDEVRPIHVVLRGLALTIELCDTFTPGATDREACAQLLRQSTDLVPSILGSFGEDRLHLLDQALGGDDVMRVDTLDTLGTLLEAQVSLDDIAPILCPLDLLIIDTGGNSPADGFN